MLAVAHAIIVWHCLFVENSFVICLEKLDTEPLQLVNFISLLFSAARV